MAEPVNYEALVTQRAQDRWAALSKFDLVTAYTYMSESSKQHLPLQDYIGSIKPTLKWQGAKVRSAVCDAEACDVSLDLTYDMPRSGIKGVVSPIKETWVIEKGTVSFVYKG